MSAPRRIVYVTGAGRFGTSMLTRVLREFALHVPGPEVAADATDPQGFPEPQWVVDLHTSMLRSAGVHAWDPRPLAWHLVDRAGTDGNALGRIRAWLDIQVTRRGDLVVNDPRLPWFLELWREAAAGTSSRVSCLTTLRPPTEVVVAESEGHQGQDMVDRVSGWINLMLGTELATRATPRAFVRHGDLVHDWDEPVFGTAAALDLPMVDPENVSAVNRVDALLEPWTAGAGATWRDVPVPAPLRTLADDTWSALDTLPDHDDAGVRAEFDRLRALYPYVYRKVAAPPSRRIARMVQADVVPPAVRQSVTGMFRRSPDAVD